MSQNRVNQVNGDRNNSNIKGPEVVIVIFQAQKMSKRIINVGIIGAGEVAQVIHIPTLGFMNDMYKITYICDNSNDTVAFAKDRVNATSKDVKTTTDAEELCSSPDVDVVMVLTADEYHIDHALLALKHDKIAFVEKPMSLTEEGAKRLLEAESKSQGFVFVGYMRRYAPAFELALKEVGGTENIQYVRVRDIIGSNQVFVGQSATFPKRFSDYSQADIDDKNARAKDLVKQGLGESGVEEYGDEFVFGWRVLGGLGSHDLALMREAIGLPKKYIGAKIQPPYMNALLDYGHFVVSYETGIHGVPDFDAHLEIYTQNKVVKVTYDTPYVKGLAITMQIKEEVDGNYVVRTIRPTFEDPYTVQAKKLYRVITEGESFKTGAEDAIKDLEIFQGIAKAAAEHSKK